MGPSRDFGSVEMSRGGEEAIAALNGRNFQRITLIVNEEGA
jgi:hypothetical protein